MRRRACARSRSSVAPRLIQHALLDLAQRSPDGCRAAARRRRTRHRAARAAARSAAAVASRSRRPPSSSARPCSGRCADRRAACAAHALSTGSALAPRRRRRGPAGDGAACRSTARSTRCVSGDAAARRARDLELRRRRIARARSHPACSRCATCCRAPSDTPLSAVSASLTPSIASAERVELAAEARQIGGRRARLLQRVVTACCRIAPFLIQHQAVDDVVGRDAFDRQSRRSRACAPTAARARATAR